MLEKLKANILFETLLKRHNIDKAYAMVKPEDSWYDTITKVHNSLAEIKKLPYENWKITSHDGLAQHAVYYPGNSDKTVIWVHGYSSHAERESAFPGLFYHNLGFNVLVPYLRAHGPSEGKYISFGPMESQDIEGWIEQINTRIPKGSIMLHGLSMGGGIVLDLATKELENVRCMIADAPSYSIPEFFKDVAGSAFKKGQQRILACVHDRFYREFSAAVTDFDRIQNIKSGKYPLLLSAGSNENMDNELYALKEHNPNETTVLILPGCDHGNGMYKQTELYQDAIKVFVEKHMAG